MSPTGWLTPDVLPDAVWRCLLVPDDNSLYACMDGALAKLQQSYNWEAYGAITVDEVTQWWRETLQRGWEGGMGCCAIGTIVAYPLSDIPENYVLANGQSLVIADYPALYDIYGLSFGAALPGQFRVPDYSELFLVGSGTTYVVGDTGGANTVQLTTNEIPAHNHLYDRMGAGTIINGENVPIPVGNGVNVPTATTNTGGSQPHENRPPFKAVNWCVVAR